MHQLLRFLLDESAQDLSEYSLLLTFIVLACISFLGMWQPATNSIWHSANTDLTTANTAAAGH